MGCIAIFYHLLVISLLFYLSIFICVFLKHSTLSYFKQSIHLFSVVTVIDKKIIFFIRLGIA